MFWKNIILLVWLFGQSPGFETPSAVRLGVVYDQDHGQINWNGARPTAYGAVPGYRPLPLGHGADLVAASAHAGIWRDGTGYYWRGARYYDSEAGQWLSFDPFGYEASDNPFGYANAPVNYYDSDGRFARGFLGLQTGVTLPAGSSRSFAERAGEIAGRGRALRQAADTAEDYLQNLNFFDGNHLNAINQTFNPATRALSGFSEAYEGRGLSPHNLGQKLSGWERTRSFGKGTVASLETVLAAQGVRTAPGTLRGLTRSGSAKISIGGTAPSPLPASAKRAAEVERLVIGRGADLARPNALGLGEFKFSWPPTGAAQTEWKVNAGLLRQEMRRLRPIRDASIGNTRGMYLNAERNLLETRGWKLDKNTSLWIPPTR